MDFTEKDITIIENATSASEQQGILKNLKSSIWRYGWPINDAYFSRPCWHSFIAGSGRPDKKSCESELAFDRKWQALSSFWERIKSTNIPRATLLGVYANGQTFGQDAPIHRDNRPREEGTTVILFCNEHWATCWGGELIFYDQLKQDIIATVMPKPGRAVLFSGHIPHSARSPSALCDQLRMTIAFKTLTS